MSLTAGEFDAAASAHTAGSNTARDLLIVDGDWEPDERRCQEFYAASARVGRTGQGYFCAATRDTISFAELPQMISELNRMTEHWQRTRTEIRFDRYEVRSWHGWHRHMTLAMVALTAMELTRRAESDQDVTM
jgi:SRSO17 transposase